MNYGATALFPPEICSHWTCYPNAGARNDPGPAGALDLETRFTVNMMGHLGLSGRIYAWDAETRKVAAERIALYKKIRPLLRTADVFHLTPQVSATSARSTQAALYVDPKSGQALLFAFQGGDPALEAVLRLRSLMADRMYRVAWPAAFGAEQSVIGKKLLEKGLTVRFPHRGASVIVPIDPQ
jgi:alpha-galactosidase